MSQVHGQQWRRHCEKPYGCTDHFGGSVGGKWGVPGELGRGGDGGSSPCRSSSNSSLYTGTCVRRRGRRAVESRNEKKSNVRERVVTATGVDVLDVDKDKDEDIQWHVTLSELENGVPVTHTGAVPTLLNLCCSPFA